jgi:aryl-alcohol dehydrogenase-like predicted oxidoreductase
MKKRKLGNSGVEVGAIGLGCMGMSFAYGARDDEHSIQTLYQAIELGVDFWDTSNMYGFGHNEELIGKVLKTNRQDVFLATKFAIKFADGKISIDGSPKHVREACELSLQRLGIDTIDLYYQHRIDPAVPIEETIGAMAELVKEGKVRFLGVSEASMQTIEKAHREHPITAVQSEYSLWTREYEEDVIPLCKQLGIAFVPYSPLGRGFLSGEIQKFEDFAADDYRRTSPRFQGENFLKNLQLVQKVQEIAQEIDCTPSQVALAWVLQQDDIHLPIPGTKKVKYLEENTAAADITLSSSTLKALDEVFPKGVAAGERYPEASMKMVNL